MTYLGIAKEIRQLRVYPLPGEGLDVDGMPRVYYSGNLSGEHRVYNQTQVLLDDPEYGPYVQIVNVSIDARENEPDRIPAAWRK